MIRLCFVLKHPLTKKNKNHKYMHMPIYLNDKSVCSHQDKQLSYIELCQADFSSIL